MPGPEVALTNSTRNMRPSAFKLLNLFTMRSATAFSEKTISNVTCGLVETSLHDCRQLIPASSNRSPCSAASISPSVVPGSKFDACSVNGPAVPLMLRPGPCEAPFLATFGREVAALMLAFPLSISLAIRLALALRCEGVVDEGLDGGLKGLLRCCVGVVPLVECRCNRALVYICFDHRQVQSHEYFVPFARPCDLLSLVNEPLSLSDFSLHSGSSTFRRFDLRGLRSSYGFDLAFRQPGNRIKTLYSLTCVYHGLKAARSIGGGHSASVELDDFFFVFSVQSYDIRAGGRWVVCKSRFLQIFDLCLTSEI